MLTHLHWDHVHGLPFFSAGDREGSRVSLLLPEQPDGAGATEVLGRVMSPPHFPIHPGELRGQWVFASVSPWTMEVDGFGVEVRDIPHKGGRTFALRVSDAGSVLTYMPDHCPSVFGPGPDGWGEYHPDALLLAEGADVLVHDAQMTAGETAAATCLGHSVPEYAVQLGRKAGVGLVVLFHHRPDRSDDSLDALPAHLGTSQDVVVAHESLVLDL